MLHACVHAKAITVHSPQSPELPPFLVVSITITCEICGEQELIVAGHHLRPIVSLLQEFIDAEPELTEAGDVEKTATRVHSYTVQDGEITS